MSENNPEDTPPDPSDEIDSPDKQFVLRSERFDEFLDGVEALYISGNQSGRINFMQTWPDAGAYIFPIELVQYDQEGRADKELRAEMESCAEEKRVALLEILQNLEDHSMHERELRAEPVRTLIADLGRNLALCIYDGAIVERFAPAPVEPEVIVEEAEAPPVEIEVAAVEQPVAAAPIVQETPVASPEVEAPVEVAVPEEDVAASPPPVSSKEALTVEELIAPEEHAIVQEEAPIVQVAREIEAGSLKPSPELSDLKLYQAPEKQGVKYSELTESAQQQETIVEPEPVAPPLDGDTATDSDEHGA